MWCGAVRCSAVHPAEMGDASEIIISIFHHSIKLGKILTFLTFPVQQFRIRSLVQFGFHFMQILKHTLTIPPPGEQIFHLKVLSKQNLHFVTEISI